MQSIWADMLIWGFRGNVQGSAEVLQFADGQPVVSAGDEVAATAAHAAADGMPSKPAARLTGPGCGCRRTVCTWSSTARRRLSGTARP